MKSPYKTAIVYDLETGGFSCKYNSITEIALVAVDLETLKIIETESTMILPRIDLRERQEEPIKEAKELFKMLKIKEEESGLNILRYKEHSITLKNLEPLVEDIEKFYDLLEETGQDILELEHIQTLEEQEDYRDIINLYLNKAYSPSAEAVTHITRDLIEEEGVSYSDAYTLVKEFIKKHTQGNSKPIFAGHNIGSLPRRIVRGKEKGPDGFDNPFMEKFFADNGDDFFDNINEKIIDTLKEARIKWSELPAYNLGTCANEVGLTLKEAHRALPDTIANAKFLIKMLENLRGYGATEKKYERRVYNFNF